MRLSRSTARLRLSARYYHTTPHRVTSCHIVSHRVALCRIVSYCVQCRPPNPNQSLPAALFLILFFFIFFVSFPLVFISFSFPRRLW